MEYADLTFAHDRSGFHPGRVNVGNVERVNELARGRVSRVRDQIGFGKAWGFDIPGVGFDGDMVFEQGTGFGATVESFFELALLGLSRRSMVAGLIDKSCSWVWADRAKRLTAHGSHRGKRALMRAEQGKPAASQMAARAEIMFAP